MAVRPCSRSSSVPAERVRGVCRASIVGALLLPLVVGCSVEEALPVPSCADGGTTILAAQSVPTAAQVPCFDPLPDGWDVDSTVIDQNGTVIRFDSDRAGSRAAIFHFVDSCETAGAVRVPSEYPGTDQYELIAGVVPAFVGRRFHVFSGGCMWWDFDFDEGAGSALSIELGDRLEMISRDELNDSIRTFFIDEEV
jgi:hypothetical protein